jgi:hypothetical protein
VSASKCGDGMKEGTFSFDTERLEWTCHGSWQLPFSGRAYYLAELDAWVGICRHKGGTGHLCSSDVVPVGVGAGTTTMPRWKLGEERLFDRESPRHLGARLVHMGGTRFCLVEQTWHEDDDDIRHASEYPTGSYVGPPRVVVRITTIWCRAQRGRGRGAATRAGTSSHLLRVQATPSFSGCTPLSPSGSSLKQCILNRRKAKRWSLNTE